MRAYGVPHALKGTLSWAWAEKRFASAHNYWVSTVDPEGRPHASAVWGLWLDGKFWFSCSPASVKAHNLAHNPFCVITTERADEAVIIEGRAAAVRGRAELLPFVRAYKRKYDWEMDPAADGYFAVTPQLGFAFIEHSDRFSSSATRYRFAGRAPRRGRR
jgi:hypothetical protein